RSARSTTFQESTPGASAMPKSMCVPSDPPSGGAALRLRLELEHGLAERRRFERPPQDPRHPKPERDRLRTGGVRSLRVERLEDVAADDVLEVAAAVRPIQAVRR